MIPDSRILLPFLTLKWTSRFLKWLCSHGDKANNYQCYISWWELAYWLWWSLTEQDKIENKNEQSYLVIIVNEIEKFHLKKDFSNTELFVYVPVHLLF